MTESKDYKDMFEIMIDEKPLEILKTIMHNVKSLNAGNEIGAWLLGKWETKDDKKVAIIKEVYIPKQTVSHTEVDISPESMMNTINSLGAKKCREIIGHWHIHPFGKGKTNWSSTDENKIDDWMNPDKQREVFLFLLSSEDWMKGRIELNIQAKAIDMNINIRESLDDMEIKAHEIHNKKLFDEIKKEIEEKVEERKYEYKSTPIKGFFSYSEDKEKQVQNLFSITMKKNKNLIELILKKDLADYIKNQTYVSDELVHPDIEKTNRKSVTWTWKLKKGERIKEIAKMLREEVEDMANELIDIMEKEESSKSYFQTQHQNYRKQLGLDRDLLDWYGTGY